MSTDQTTPGTPVTDARTGRRKAIMGLAGLAAGGAAVVVAGAEPAGANGQGQSLTLGDVGNTASATTGLTLDQPSQPALLVTNSSLGSAIVGVRDEASGIHRNGAAITADSATGNALEALSGNQIAIVAKSESHHAILGQAFSAVGVIGESERGYGVWGRARGLGYGVAGSVDAESDSQLAAGVVATNVKGTALLANGKVQARLQPAAEPGPPTRVEAGLGSLHVDSLGVLRLNVATNQWRTVGGPTSSGAFHVLPAPARIYDSRPGTQPAIGPKSKLAAGAARVLDVTANASGVPAEATAVLLTVLLVNAPNANGNLTVWADGVAKPLANSMVWGGSAGRFTAAPTSAVAAGKVQVSASHATDVVIDVVGYYA